MHKTQNIKITDIVKKDLKIKTSHVPHFLKKYINNEINTWKKKCRIPISVAEKYKFDIQDDALIVLKYTNTPIKNKITITNELLWLIGFFIAEGCNYTGERHDRFYKNGNKQRDYKIIFGSDIYLLNKAIKIIKD